MNFHCWHQHPDKVVLALIFLFFTFRLILAATIGFAIEES